MAFWLLGVATVMLLVVVFRQARIAISSLRSMVHDANLSTKLMFLAHGIVSCAGPIAIAYGLFEAYIISVTVQAIVSFWTYMIFPLFKKEEGMS